MAPDEFVNWAIEKYSEEFPRQLLVFCDQELVAHGADPKRVVGAVRAYAEEHQRCPISDFCYVQMPPYAVQDYSS